MMPATDDKDKKEDEQEKKKTVLAKKMYLEDNEYREDQIQIEVEGANKIEISESERNDNNPGYDTDQNLRKSHSNITQLT